MEKIYNKVEELIGNTPLFKLEKLKTKYNLKANVYAKLEGNNPGGSIKDRVALSMLNEAEKAGLIKKNATIIEPTSGNTGIGLAMISASRGYRAIIVMPNTMSEERITLLKGYNNINYIISTTSLSVSGKDLTGTAGATRNTLATRSAFLSSKTSGSFSLAMASAVYSVNWRVCGYLT